MNLLTEITKVFSGRKTYLVAGLLAFAVFAKTMGWLDESSYKAIEGVLLAGGLASLRAGVSK